MAVIIVVVPVAAPEAVIPVDRCRPDGSGHRAREEGGSRVPVIGVGVGIVGDRNVGVIRLIEHFRLILRNVDGFAAGRLDDDVLAAVVDLGRHLHLVVGPDDAVGHRLRAQLLDGVQNVFLLVDDGLAEELRPLKVVAHHLDELGIVQQRDDAAVPCGLGLQVLLGLGVLEEAFGLDDLQRIERGSRDQRHELVRIECDARHEDVEFLGRQRLRRLGLVGGRGGGFGRRRLGVKRGRGTAECDHRGCREQKRPGEQVLQKSLRHVVSHSVRGRHTPGKRP